MMQFSHILLMLCRRKRLNVGDSAHHHQAHSEWYPRLGRCSLTIIAITLMLAITLHVILPAIFSDYLNRKTEVFLATPMLSLAFTSALIILSTTQLCSISRRIAKNGALYQMAHCTCGQAVAVAVAWAQLLDQIGLIGTVCHALSDHINLLFHNAFSVLRLTASVPPPPHLFSLDSHSSSSSSSDGGVVVSLDLLAVVLPLCAALVMMCSVRVLITSSTIFLIATMFTSASTTTVAFLHNVAKLRMIGNEEGVKTEEEQQGSSFSSDELFLLFRWWLLAWPCIELFSFLAEECIRPRRVLPSVMCAVSRIQPVLALLALLAFFPFIGAWGTSRGGIDDAARASASLPLPLPAMFNSIRLFSARYLMNVGSVCSLWAALLSLFLAPTRLLATLAMDRMGFPFGQKYFVKIAKKGGQPRLAVLFVALCSTLITAIVPKKLLCRLIPLNCVLRIALQGLLVYVCHFTPSSSEYFLGDYGGASQEYQRVRPSRGTNRRRSVDAQASTTVQKMCDDKEEDEEDYGEEEQEDNSTESEDEAWFRECREREQLLERIWRMGTCETAEDGGQQQMKSSSGTPLLELNNKSDNPLRQFPNQYQQQQQRSPPPFCTTYQSFQNHAPSTTCCHLPRQQQNDGASKYHQRHNCFRAPCSTTAVTTMTVNGRTMHTVPFHPGQHLYEADASSFSWLDPSGTAATLRVESGTKAAAARDEHSACAATQRALLLVFSAAAVCTAAHSALRNASVDYLPLLPLLAVGLAIGIVCSVVVWLGRLRVDYNCSTDHRQQQPADGKSLPIGAVVCVFTVVQLFPLFPAVEWFFVVGWLLIGIFLHALLLSRLDNKN